MRPIEVMGWMLAISVLAAASVGAQTQTPPPPSSQTQTQSQAQKPTQPQLPLPGQPNVAVDLDKIKNALEKPPALNLDEQQLRFYVLVYAKQPLFATFMGKFDLKNGPVPRAGMTHQEFLKQVTPKELYATSGGITPMEALQAAITNMLGQEIIKRGLREIQEAKSQREIQAIRDRIDRELAALAGKG